MAKVAQLHLYRKAHERYEYHPDFERFWACCWDRNRGSKKHAAQLFKRFQGNKEWVDYLCDRATAQRDEVRKIKASGEWVAERPHVERWLRNDGWDDDTV